MDLFTNWRHHRQKSQMNFLKSVGTMLICSDSGTSGIQSHSLEVITHSPSFLTMHIQGTSVNITDLVSFPSWGVPCRDTRIPSRYLNKWNNKRTLKEQSDERTVRWNSMFLESQMKKYVFGHKVRWICIFLGQKVRWISIFLAKSQMNSFSKFCAIHVNMLRLWYIRHSVP